MNHQPYKNWILSESDLSGEQLRELETHLDDCEDCQQFRQNLRAANWLFKTAPMAAPAAGFSQRWQASLLERQAAQQRRQTRIFLLGLAGAALILLLLIAIHIIATSTPVEWVIAAFQSTFGIFSTWITIQNLVLELVVYIPPIVPILLWILLAGGLSTLTLIWIISLWRISSKGAPQNES